MKIIWITNISSSMQFCLADISYMELNESDFRSSCRTMPSNGIKCCIKDYLEKQTLTRLLTIQTWKSSSTEMLINSTSTASVTTRLTHFFSGSSTVFQEQLSSHAHNCKFSMFPCSILQNKKKFMIKNEKKSQKM